MTAAYLTFARGEGVEQSRPADLVELVRDVAANARRTGARVEVAGPETLAMPLRADAVRRCLGNLVDNARRHAQRITVGVRTVPRTGLGGPGGTRAASRIALGRDHGGR